MTQDQGKEELRLEFNQCPKCGSTERLGDYIFKRNPPANIPPGAKTRTAFHQQIIPLQQTGLLTGKALVVLTDYCLECGIGYVIAVFEKSGHIELRRKTP